MRPGHSYMVKIILTLAVIPAVFAGRFVAAGATFSSSINLGAILVGLLVIVVAGLFTIRSNVAKVWRENYEGEKERADNLDTEAKKQREAKHDAINELSALKLLLSEAQKHDQAAVLAQLAAMQENAQKLTQASVESLMEVTRKSEERLVEQIGLLVKSQGDIAKTTSGLVEAVEKLNRRMDEFETKRNGS